jgi:hypothetical protein
MEKNDDINKTKKQTSYQIRIEKLKLENERKDKLIKDKIFENAVIELSKNNAHGAATKVADKFQIDRSSLYKRS